MWRFLLVSAVSLTPHDHFLHNERRSDKRSVGAADVFPQVRSAEGESHFCGFTSSGNSMNVGIDSAPIWSKYVEAHRLERSRGCDGRYLIWKCTETETCGGFGDEIRGMSAMLYLAVATDRALVLDWRKDGVSYAGNVFGVKTVDWTMPEHCAWNPKLFHVIDPPYDGLNDLVEHSADHSAESKVIEVITNLQTPQQSPDLWKTALESRPALKEVSEIATLSVGCAYSFLFEPTSALREAYERVRIRPTRSTSFIGIHLRVGDQGMQRSLTDPLRVGVSLLAQCVDTGLALLRGNDPGGSACKKPASDLAFFSDSQAVKEFSKTAGMLVTGVLPLHSEKDFMSAEQRRATIAELHALADSTVFLTDTRRSGFASLALELGEIRQCAHLESFGMRILPDGVELCKDRARGPFQTFGDSSPTALALDTRQKYDTCVALKKASAETMQVQREE